MFKLTGQFTWGFAHFRTNREQTINNFASCIICYTIYDIQKILQINTFMWAKLPRFQEEKKISWVLNNW